MNRLVLAKRLALFLICMLFVGLLSAAEGSYKSGYIITNNNDTIFGEILCANTNLYQKCVFKKEGSDKSIEYSPGAISAYRFFDNGKFYVSRETPLRAGKKLIFLEYLIKGKASAYYYRDNSNHFFIETEREPLIEISEPDTILQTHEGEFYYKEPSYRGKLRFLLSDCPQLVSKINRTELFSKELIDLFKDYHERVCTYEQCVVFERKIPKIKLNYGVVAGLALSNFWFNTVAYSDWRTNAFVGGQVEIENVFLNIDQTFFRIGLTLQKYAKFTYHNDVYVENGIFYFHDEKQNIDMNVIDVRLPITINYKLSLNKFSPYIGCGLANHFFLTSNKSFLVVDYYYYFGHSFPSYYLGLLGNIGFKYRLESGHVIQFETGYEYFQNPSVNKMVRMKNQSIFATLGYCF